MDRYIYVAGEQQNAVLVERDEIYTFTGEQMRQVETGELVTVLANVFGLGQFFPGPQEALTAVVHEFIRRNEDKETIRAGSGETLCRLITVFKRFDGEISVQYTAVLNADPGMLDPENPDSFHDLLLESLPSLQQALTAQAFAVDSRIVTIIKEATMHHIHRRLD
ncbi:hypothetical protein [Desulfobulbus alkaliphilus]|uniref:hypothetical protein n=1 Tax=Desulfobulbus alkaliphilus TaxID=869814 RepID=UPI00196318F1|nr:hypothetical protein [Desulfobulbus alkaliphilus]MBM9538060.1 hypothetical protein [Desulfobulbus alkaliphilus]